MRALHHTSAEHREHEISDSLIKAMGRRSAQLGEMLWFVTTFILFLLMGPFSIIGVIYGLWALGSKENREKMVAPASCRVS